MPAPPVQSERDSLTELVIGLAIEVHRALGPGLLESAYQECLCYELKANGIAFGRQVALAVVYKSVNLDCGYRMDLVVDDRLVVELTTVEKNTSHPRGTAIDLFEIERDTNRIAPQLQYSGHENGIK